MPDTIKTPDTFEAIINGKNRVTLEGHIAGKKYNPKNKKLFFKVVAFSTSTKTPGKVFTMSMPVFFYNNAAEELNGRTYDLQYVEVEAKLRGEDKVIDIEELYKSGKKYYRYTEYKLIGTHITGAEQVKKSIPLPEPKGDING